MLRMTVTAARERKRLTLVELAERTGLSLPFLYRIERGDRPNPSVATARALASALGVTSDALIFGYEVPHA